MKNIILVLACTAIITHAAGQATVSHDTSRIAKLRPVFGAIDQMFRSHATKNNIPGIAYGVVVDGKLIHSGAHGILETKNNTKATPSSLFRIASMTKSFTAMAIVRLRDEGKLSLTDPASKYIPEMKNFKYLTKDAPEITIHNLLTMTAGFPEDNPWGDRQLEDTPEELRAFLKQGVSFSNIPGKEFEYSNLGYAILGDIVSRVSGMPFQQYIRQNIFAPLGMNETEWEFTKVRKDKLAIGYRWEDDQWKEEPMLHDGSYGSMGGLITSIEEFCKYMILHLSAYPASSAPDNGPVKRKSIREMHRPFLSTMYPDAKRADGTPCPVSAGYGYGLGARVDCKGLLRISHSGGLPGFGSEYKFYPEYGIGVVSFANRTYAGTGGVNTRVLDTLVTVGNLQPRKIQPSEILVKRTQQVAKLVTSWDEKLAGEIVAENFFLDLDRKSWMKFTEDLFAKAGQIKNISEIEPLNQLRGTFRMTGEKKTVHVFFTLTPEVDPKVQMIELWIPEDQK